MLNPVPRLHAESGELPPALAPADCAEANCFYEPPMLDAALAAYDSAGAVRVLDARDVDGQLIARLPVEGRRAHGRWTVAHVANWVHAHCFYGAPLLRSGREEEGWAGLFAQLDGAAWSGAFLHLRLIDPDGPAARALTAVCARQGRRLREIARHERALLASDLSADAYWQQTVRAKKRKELRRLQNRLSEQGTVVHAILSSADDVPRWCEDFLALERSGWKGAEGTALATSPRDEAFFRSACARAFAADALDMLRIDCDGRAIAILVNFVGPRGGFSFKIAIDEDFARYSPGVLIELDNLARVLDERRVPWMDSCAAPDHPMIDSLWAERRTIVQYRIPINHNGLRNIKARGVRLAIAATERLARQMKTKAET